MSLVLDLFVVVSCVSLVFWVRVCTPFGFGVPFLGWLFLCLCLFSVMRPCLHFVLVLGSVFVVACLLQFFVFVYFRLLLFLVSASVPVPVLVLASLFRVPCFCVFLVYLRLSAASWLLLRGPRISLPSTLVIAVRRSTRS